MVAPGTRPITDEAARTLDSQIRECSKEMWRELTVPPYFERRARLNRAEMSTIMGCEVDCGFQPDGGVITFHGIPLLAFEAKKQGQVGNAIERMFKNLYLFQKLSPDGMYVIFVSGSGASRMPDGRRSGTLALMQTVVNIDGAGVLNELGAGTSAFVSEEGFGRDVIKDIMRKAMEKSFEVAAAF